MSVAGPAVKGSTRARLTRLADALATAAALSIPWSTSLTGICSGAWIVVCLTTLTLSSVRRALLTPAGGFAALLGACGSLGVLWADVSWPERLGGADTFARLLLIPLLLAQFGGSQRARPVLAGFLASCTALLVVSGALVFWPALGKGWAKDISPGVPVKDYIAQSGEFVLCAFALAPVAIAALRARRFLLAAGLCALALAFMADVLYVATGRTTVVVILVLLVVFCLRSFSWKGALAALAAAAVLVAAVWASSPYLRTRVGSLMPEIEHYQSANAVTSAGERLEYWKKSIGFIAEAPLIGHGTGTIPELFRRSIVGQSGPGAEASSNPHNQIFTVALQIGFVGTVLLFAMWMSHLLLFRGAGLAAWIGLVVVVENIVGSMFNSYLFDFTQGWIYVLGVGAAGGLVLSDARAKGASAPSPPAEPA